MTTRFSDEHPWAGSGDRFAFPTLVLIAWVGVVMGFGGDIQHHVKTVGFVYPAIVHVHAFVFVMWLVMFTVQVLLIRTGRQAIHRKLGILMLCWAVAMVIVGPLTALVTQRLELGTPHSDPAFLVVQFGDLAIFAPLIAAGALWRKIPSAHKRLMMLGTLHITDAGFARWTGGAIFHLIGDGYLQMWLVLFAGSNAVIALLGLYDLVTRRRLHPAYLAGVAWALLVQFIAVAIYQAPAWLPVAKALIGK